MLTLATAAVATLAIALPYVPPVATLVGLVPLPWHLLLAGLGVVTLYIAATEAAKAIFYAHTAQNRAMLIRG